MSAPATAVRRRAPLPSWALYAGAAAVLAVLFLVFRGRSVLPHDDDIGLFHTLNDARDWVQDNKNTHPVFLYLLNYVSIGIGHLVDALTSIVEFLGWPGVVGAAGATGWAASGWRTGLVGAAGFLAIGVLGLWEDGAETLALTVAAVLIALVVGLPLGIAAGRADRLRRLLDPVLDAMQIMPAFAYLAPMALVFGIGAPSATVTTLIYAVPPAIRITALGIRRVAPASVEASESLGATRLQTLRAVQLPMAVSTIMLAVNQTIMMALAMVVITALIGAPGLGVTILDGLQHQNVGAAFDAGLAIVILAIVLDRLTRGAGGRGRGRAAVSSARRRAELAGAAAVALAGAVLGRTLPRDFPESLNFTFTKPVNELTGWIEDNLSWLTGAIKDAVTYGLLNPAEKVLTEAPWWLVVIAVVLAGLRLCGTRAAVTAGACLAAIAALGLWQHSMKTLTSVVAAALLTLAVGIALGVGAARSRWFSAGLRPVLDAAQTLPSFVYLVPAIALFGASRFTAIAAAVIYAVPPVVRLVEDGLRGVPATVVEAATASGSTRRQLLWKVRLPMARRGLLLAANQGIVMVLAMVVVGGMVGAGGLGFDVVTGFSQTEDFGLGLAAGIAIVLLGVMLDRLTQGAGRTAQAAGGRGGSSPHTRHRQDNQASRHAAG
ncbi:ABC transporter permease [Spirillospora sp. CA-294931]|uniref:ABC transporter permease n=1 Tax=Spirillospora sp. CA-294931 TaxID=3240042 RepID=UPI003D90EB33